MQIFIKIKSKRGFSYSWRQKEASLTEAILRCFEERKSLKVAEYTWWPPSCWLWLLLYAWSWLSRKEINFKHLRENNLNLSSIKHSSIRFHTINDHWNRQNKYILRLVLSVLSTVQLLGSESLCVCVCTWNRNNNHKQNTTI